MIQLGQQFKLKNVAGYGSKMIMTVTRIENGNIHYTAGKYGEGVLTEKQFELYDNLGSVRILEHQACGCFYIDNELNLPCENHVERVLSPVVEVEVERMFAGV